MYDMEDGIENGLKYNAVTRFIDEYAGTAIGASIKNQYDNGADIDDMYAQIEDFGY